MFRAMYLFLVGIGFCMLPVLSDAAGHFDPTVAELIPEPCGDCWYFDQWTCEDLLGMSGDCHGWQNGEGADPRCSDPHTPYGEGYIGTGTCLEEHPGECTEPGCGSEDLEEDLSAAVAESDMAAVERVLSGLTQAWVEVNEEQRAVQVLTRCAKDPIGSVVWHIPIPPDKLSFWATTVSESVISAPPTLRTGSWF